MIINEKGGKNTLYNNQCQFIFIPIWTKNCLWI